MMHAQSVIAQNILMLKMKKYDLQINKGSILNVRTARYKLFRKIEMIHVMEARHVAINVGLVSC